MDPKLARVLGPGLLVAATGVGAGDLATASFTGNQLGMAVLWAVWVGALFKYVLNEGLARYQLISGNSLLHGVLNEWGRPAGWLFLIYFIPWSFFVGTALMSASGAAAHALIPVVDSPRTGKVFWGIAQSLVGVGLVMAGGYELFEKIMKACIGLMFAVVVVTVIAIGPDWLAVARGLTLPTIPEIGGQGLTWTVALIGGIGGTLTMLCYGYWIKEEGRSGENDLEECRMDLAVGYAVTAIFGAAMVIIGHHATITGKGAGLLIALADSLESSIGVAGRWAFLLGAWAAIFSSLLGVWQSVPYLFADFWTQWTYAEWQEHPEKIDTEDRPYVLYLLGLAIVPMIGLFFSFKAMQKYYAVVGAAFLPLLAIALLFLNGREESIDRRFRNRFWSNLGLGATLLFFLAAGTAKIAKLFAN